MYFGEILRLLSLYLRLFAGVLFIPFAVAIYYEFFASLADHPQPHSSLAFAVSILVTMFLSFIFAFVSKAQGKAQEMFRREALILVVSIWFISAFVGALPFYFSGTLNRPTDAYFEAMSGLTTTGASLICAKEYDKESKDEIPIIYKSTVAPYQEHKFYGNVAPVYDEAGEERYVGLEAVSKAVLFWRSMMQWLGGMGVVVMFVAILPALGVGGKVLYQAEVPGPQKGGMTPRIRETASLLWRFYFSFTLLEVLLLYYTNNRVSWFDAITISFSNISTGGFSVRNASIASYKSAVTEWIVVAFMLIGSTNFLFYYKLLHKKFREAFDAELKTYFSLLFIGSLVVSFYLFGISDYSLDGSLSYLGFWDSLRVGTFHLISSQTSTGFGTSDFDQWPFFTHIVMLVSMYIGGMSGSTGGGVKVVRFIVTFKIIQNIVEKIFRPETIRQAKLNNSIIDNKAALTILAYLLIVLFCSCLGTFLFAWDGLDLETSLSISTCMINNIGISFRVAGPTESFAFLSDFSKWVSVIWMVLGRLEFFAILVMLTPSFWRVK